MKLCIAMWLGLSDYAMSPLSLGKEDKDNTMHSLIFCIYWRIYSLLWRPSTSEACSGWLYSIFFIFIFFRVCTEIIFSKTQLLLQMLTRALLTWTCTWQMNPHASLGWLHQLCLNCRPRSANTEVCPKPRKWEIIDNARSSVLTKPSESQALSLQTAQSNNAAVKPRWSAAALNLTLKKTLAMHKSRPSFVPSHSRWLWKHLPSLSPLRSLNGLCYSSIW